MRTKYEFKSISPLSLAVMFHEAYEFLAPQFGYNTRKDTREFDPASPNGKLMIMVANITLDRLKNYFIPKEEVVEWCNQLVLGKKTSHPCISDGYAMAKEDLLKHFNLNKDE